MSQKALLLEEVGKPLSLGHRAIPEPGENQLLVKVLVAGLNPHDQRTRDDGLFATSFPYVIASDLVGEVVTVGTGEHSAKFTLGEHVFGHTFAEGGLAMTSTLRSNMPLLMRVIVLAAFVALFAPSGHGLPPPFSPEAKSFDYSSVSLLIIGGGSNTGRAVVELANLAGIGQIIAIAGKQNEANLKAIGATHVIDRRAPDVLEQIRAIAGDELIYAVDTVNAGLDQELGVAALSNRKKGTLITLRRPDGGLDAAQLGSKAAGYERRLVFGVSPIHPELTMKFWEEAPRWYKEGKLGPSSFEVIQGLDADAVNKALDKYRDGAGVKINIHPWE
ncbi:hypothetical protein AU210_005614 [Fusarium oxysporum f. sp. radicis-cucumerinum]|uniref:Enoyl reductase (ER) domain-containing protein n=1 Tax=Fusarium oxysporum f. sp. radicis-cucumerinum TaxID=327505 RepID=A0A2H3H4T7_FUSOX|nr:hypothetical protein AU210_005614 [Fusarium oxysporum f. sp. radicis-cucumerinum]